MNQRRSGRPAGEPALDSATLRAVCARDRGALARFFDCFYDRVYGHLVRMLGEPTLAEDLTQDAFLRMHRDIDRLDPERDPAPWVFTVATNTVRDYWRSREHKSQQRRSGLDPEQDLALPDGRLDELTRIEGRESEAAIRKALADLEPTDRQIILLRSYEDLDSSTVGEMLGITPEAVRQRHRRAIARLGKVYGHHTGKAEGGA